MGVHPNNRLTTQLLKDANGQYFGGDPFSTAARPTLWGLPVAVTPVIAAGTALVGVFGIAAQMFRKGGLRPRVSGSLRLLAKPEVARLIAATVRQPTGTRSQGSADGR